ncbi:MAG: trypsin-like peptidase domain-containing protein [Gemmataceae bacterium]|nr:trypsin-like peptidase domain-containing protein [Gemmataceae bacterium]
MTLPHRLLGLAAVTLLAAPSPAQQLSADAKSKVMAATAFIQGKKGHGSGFVVKPGVFATNAHVVRDEIIDDVRARFIDAEGNEKKFAVKLLSIDKARDLALLWAKELPGDYKPLAIASKVEIASRPSVFVIGNPAQAEGGISLINSLGIGNLGNEMVMREGKPYYQLTVATSRESIRVGPGNSGGPIVNGKGEVVGVLTAGIIDLRTRRPTEKMYAVPASAVQAAIDGIGVPTEWEKASAKAVERHATDLTVRSVYANVLIAETVLKARKSIWENAFAPSLFFTYVNGNPVNEDKGMIDLFNKCDKAIRDKTRLTSKAALDGTALPKDQKQQLRTMMSKLDSIRPVVVGKKASATQVKKCEEMILECDKAFEKIAAETGWTKTDVLELELAILLEAGVKLAEVSNN